MKSLKPITDNKGEVHQIYLDYAQQSLYGLSNPKVLKTDCYNEVHHQPKGGIAGQLSGDIYLVEIDRNLVKECHQSYPELNVLRGDIRALPFKDECFDVVLDLSTLDHVKPDEVGKVLAEYARVLKKEGRLLLVVWTGLNKEAWVQNEKDDGQYYFRKKDLERDLFTWFRQTSHKVIYEEGFRRLHVYFLEK